MQEKYNSLLVSLTKGYANACIKHASAVTASVDADKHASAWLEKFVHTSANFKEPCRIEFERYESSAIAHKLAVESAFCAVKQIKIALDEIKNIK